MKFPCAVSALSRCAVRCAVLAAALLWQSAALAQGASFRLAFDVANLGLNGGNGYKTSSNDSGTLAWGESYIMMSYAAMFRATGDPGYLVTLADHALSVLAQRDSVKGLKDFAGKSRPCWQSSKYSADGKGYCWVVHSGMITYPMADLVYLLNQTPALKALSGPGGQTLGQAAATVLAEVQKVVATHDFQYVAGSGASGGYYRGDPAAKATVPSVAGVALPLNQMNAMARTLVLLWKVTGSSAYQAKAQGLATYLKARLKLKGNAYVWTYWGTAWTASGQGEDISHAAINADFAALAQRHGLVFSKTDMQRLGRTLFENVHLSSVATADKVDGSGTTGSYSLQVGRWLNLAPFEARAWPVAANVLAPLMTAKSSTALISLAMLAQHAPPVREYSFYPYDWQDLGTYQKALKYGANVLILPPDSTKPYVMKLGYRASLAAWLDQWDGALYHHGHRLAATSGSSFAWVFVPYAPEIYKAYSGTKALFQFTDAFVAGKGIEVQKVQAVAGPQILTTSLAPATVGKPYKATLSGSGDAPLLWSLEPAGQGASVDLKTGVLSFAPTAAHLPQLTLTVKLTNDSGQAEKKLAIQVLGLAKDAGTPAPDKGPVPKDSALPADLPQADGPAAKADLAPHVDTGIPADSAGGTDLAPTDSAGGKDLTAAESGGSRDGLASGKDGLPSGQDASTAAAGLEGGCSCAMEGGPGPDGALALLLCALFLAAVRRRGR